MIEIDLSTALVLYLFAYLGIVLLFWCRYEWKQHKGEGSKRHRDENAAAK